MPEKKLRAIILGIILWAILFGVASYVMMQMSEDLIEPAIVAATPILALILGYVYMQRPKEKSGWEGFRLGMTWFVMSLIFDVAILVYILGAGWEFFENYLIWIYYAELILFGTIVGYLMQGNTEAQKKNETLKTATTHSTGSGQAETQKGAETQNLNDTKKVEDYIEKQFDGTENNNQNINKF